jgi:Ca2+-binding RTX toxin-like protein
VVTQATVGPAFIEVPETGIIEVSSQAQGANIVIEGTGTAEVFIGTATIGGNPQTAAGTAYQIADDYQGTATVNLTGSIVGESKVDLTTETPEGSSIAENAPTGTNDLDFYVKTGAGNDQVQGTDGVDFIRLGAGNDSFNAGAGDDIVRVGIGNDSGTLGAGDDILYLTVDQLQGDNVNTITDFDANGNDKIQLDANLEDLVVIDGIGNSAITITLTGAQTGTTAVVSQGQSIDADDIEFV